MKNIYKNLFFAVATALLAVPALAQDAAAAGKTHELAAVFAQTGGWMALASGLCIAIAALGGALGQGKAAAAALDGVARNPAASGKLTLPLILSLALIESLVIYALIIAFGLSGTISSTIKILQDAGH